MILARELKNNDNTRKLNHEFIGFEPVLEPVRDLSQSVFGLETTRILRSVYDQNDYILVKNDHKMVKFQVKDILYIEGKGNYVSLFTLKSKILSLLTMKKLEEFLLPYQFVRVHKSFIVSLHNLDSINKNTVFINNIEIPVSDSYRESFRKFLGDHTKQI